jgi:hypothetical protein
MDDILVIKHDKINWIETSALVIGVDLFIWALVKAAEVGNAFN